MQALLRIAVALLLAFSTATAESQAARIIASLIAPEKLATLGERGANPRVQKATYWLWNGKTVEHIVPADVAAEAVKLIGWGGTEKGVLTAAALVRNLEIAEKLGATTPPDLEAMRRGRCATVRDGPYAGDVLSVDHIIPRSAHPEFDNVIANLELMPLRVNMQKSNKMGDRQTSLLAKFRQSGLAISSHR